MKRSIRYNVLIVIVILSLSKISFGQSNNCRAFYLPNINTWLGNTVEENKRLSYAANNGFNYIIFYDLHLLDYNSNTQKNNLASFLSKAKNNYGIVQAGACAESYSFFANKILPYNNSRSISSEKFNVLNFEFEFWVSSTISQYYCSDYLQPNGYNCDTAGAFAYSFKQFKKIDSLCAANGLISEVYLGWPNKGQMQNLANVADRILLHAYQTTDANLFSYTRNRLIDVASINRAVTILPIFSSEPSFLGPWLQTHPIYQPYQTYSNSYVAETGTWKQFINLQGYTWFYYPTMPQTTSGTASITASGSTTLCLGDSIVLTASSGSSYLWNPGGQTTQSITVKQTGNYFVNVISSNGAAVTSPPVSVNVGANQAPVSVTASGPVSFCTGGSVTLTCNSAGPYLWNNGSTLSSITVTNSGNYSVNIQTGNCVASSAPIEVIVSDIPAVPVITSDDLVICPGSELTLNTTATGELLWSTGDTTGSIEVDSAGSFWVRVFNGPSCYSQSALISISILPSPPNPVVSASGNTTICDGDNITLTSTPADEYEWSNGETTQSITVSQSGNYFVSVTTGDCHSVLTSPAMAINVLTASPQILFEGSDSICIGDSVKLYSSIPADSYLWSNGSTSSSVFISDPGTIQLTIQSANCSFVSNTVSVYETNTIPNPIISVNGPTSLCPGQSATLTSSPAGSYLWSDGSTASSITVSQAGNYSVSVQSGTCSATSDHVTINVNNTVAPVISANGPLTFCSGGSVTLTSTPADTYLWSSDATTSSIVVTTTGNYSVTVQSGGCSKTSAVTNVIVDSPLPIPVIAASGSLTFCIGGSVTLTSSIAPNYMWSNGATSRSITISQTGAYSVAVLQGSCNSISLPKNITVNPLPPKPAITASGSTNLCSGQSVTLTSSSSTSNVWSTGATTISISVTQPGNYSVKTVSGNCTSPTSDPKSVTVTSLPSRPTISASGSLSICPGAAVTLTSSATSQNLWSTGATTRSIVASGAGSYWVKVTQNGCTSSQSSTSTVSIRSAPSKPTITITGSTTLQNSSSSVTLKSSLANSYLWSNNSTSRSIVVRTPGTYRVTVFNSNGCSSTSNDVKVKTNACTPPTTPVVTLSGSNILQPGASVVLTSTSATSYLWSTGATTQSITVSAAGTYTVRAYSAANCYSTSLPVKIYYIASRLADTDNNVEDELKAYPNPAHEIITFSFNSEIEKNAFSNYSTLMAVRSRCMLSILLLV